MMNVSFDGVRRLARTSLLALLPVLSLSFPAAGQQHLYMPRNIRNSVRAGTRTLDGRPGPRYWQNHARYTMTVTVMPPDRRVAGTEQITYLNDSPDTLPGLVIKLFQNYHKPGAHLAGGPTQGKRGRAHPQDPRVGDAERWDLGGRRHREQHLEGEVSDRPACADRLIAV